MERIENDSDEGEGMRRVAKMYLGTASEPYWLEATGRNKTMNECTYTVNHRGVVDTNRDPSIGH